MRKVQRDKLPIKEVNLIVTGTNWTSSGALGVAYQLESGLWRMQVHITGNVSVGVSSLTLSIEGVEWASRILYQPFTGGQTSWASSTYFIRTSGTNDIIMDISSARTGFSLSGDVALALKPDWME